MTFYKRQKYLSVLLYFALLVITSSCKKDKAIENTSGNGNGNGVAQGGPYYLKFQRDGESFVYQNGLNGYSLNIGSSKYIYDSVQNIGILSFNAQFANTIIDTNYQYGEIQFYYPAFEFNNYFGHESAILDSLFYVGIHPYESQGNEIIFRKYDANTVGMADNEFFFNDPNSFFEITESVEIQSSPVVKRRIKGTFNCKISESNSGATRIIENGQFNLVIVAAQ